MDLILKKIVFIPKKILKNKRDVLCRFVLDRFCFLLLSSKLKMHTERVGEQYSGNWNND